LGLRAKDRKIKKKNIRTPKMGETRRGAGTQTLKNNVGGGVLVPVQDPPEGNKDRPEIRGWGVVGKKTISKKNNGGKREREEGKRNDHRLKKHVFSGL